jgi:hypothetical protein
LLFCEFDPQLHQYDYDVYRNLDSAQSKRVGYRKGIPVRDLDTFERLSHYYGQSRTKWRSGVKHDCAAVMELQKIGRNYVNGLGETADIEPMYLYPFLKSSDIANNRTQQTQRYMLVTQKIIGEPTSPIKQLAPKTWAYLEAHAAYLDERKSRIYQHNPRFSVFGVGPYTFSPFKIAISGLYKRLEFRLIGPIAGKPVVFDDTIYFLSFNTEHDARKVFNILTSPIARDFYTSLIFWDEKRPIKSCILNSLNLQQFDNTQAILKLF